MGGEQSSNKELIVGDSADPGWRLRTEHQQDGIISASLFYYASV